MTAEERVAAIMEMWLSGRIIEGSSARRAVMTGGEGMNAPRVAGERKARMEERLTELETRLTATQRRKRIIRWLALSLLLPLAACAMFVRAQSTTTEDELLVAAEKG